MADDFMVRLVDSIPGGEEMCDAQQLTSGNEDMEALLHRLEVRLNAEGRAPKTIRMYVRIARWLSEFLTTRGKDTSNATEQDLLDWRDEYAVGKDANTVNAVTCAVKKFLGVAGRKDLLEVLVPPKTHIKRIKELTPEELRRVFEVAGENENPFLAKRNQAMVTYGIEMAKRPGAVVGLKTEDVDLESGIIITRREKDQDDHQRKVTEACLKVLRAYAEVRPRGRTQEDDAYFFLTEDGQHISYEGYRRVVKLAGVKANIGRPIAPHLLKRSRLTQLGKGGMLPRDLQAFGDHKSYSTTTRYWNPDEEAMTKVAEELSVLGSSRTEESVKIEPAADRFDTTYGNKGQGGVGDRRRKLAERLADGEIDGETYKMAVSDLNSGMLKEMM